MTAGPSASSVFIDAQTTVQVRPVTVNEMSCIARDNAASVGPIVQAGLAGTLGQATGSHQVHDATQKLFSAAPVIIDAVIRAGTDGKVDTARIGLGIRAELIGAIVRQTLDRHSLMTIASALIMPSLTAGIIGNPTTNRSRSTSIN